MGVRGLATLKCIKGVTPQRHRLQQMEREDNEDEEVMPDTETGDLVKGKKEGGQISLHALEGHPSEKMIKIRGNVGKMRLLILIDSGSSHSFLDKSTAKELLCVL